MAPASDLITKYLRLLQSLLPRGAAWNRDDDSVLSQLLLGEAVEFARVHERSDDLITERDVRNSSELLFDHELDLGLPDECFVGTPTVQERKDAAYAKLTFRGRQNKTYFIELTSEMGADIEIIEYQPFWCGVMGSGEPCGDQETIFYWTVITPWDTDSQVLCYLLKYKPAHTVLLFDYAQYAFNTAFSSAFDIYFGGGNFDYYAFSSAFDKTIGNIGDFAYYEFGGGFYKG